MANDTKATTASATTSASASSPSPPKKVVKASAPVDPVATRNLIRLLNILALLLASLAFLLQLFAVVTHHWKWQVTGLGPVLSSHDKQTNTYDNNSRLEQHYGLYSRNVKVYANNDEQVDVWTSTQFPRIDDGEENFHSCLTRATTLRGALLTCAERIHSPPQCHCRRYFHWNLIIVLEIIALILLGLVVIISALVTTQFQPTLKLVGTALAVVAFILMLISLIVLIGYLKRETRSLADAYPHTYHQLARSATGTKQRQATPLRKAVRREAPEIYRAYSLLPGQEPHNETHLRQYSQEANAWIYIPYSSLGSADPAPQSQQGQVTTVVSTKPTTSGARLYSKYGPVVGYDTVYANTNAYIGWSTILSIIAMILALLIPLLLVFSWLKEKTLGPGPNTTVECAYGPVPTEVTLEQGIAAKPIPPTYDLKQPISSSIVQTHNVRDGLPAPTTLPPVVPKSIPTSYDSQSPISAALVKTHNIQQGPPPPPSSSSAKTTTTDNITPRPITNEAVVTTHINQQKPSEPAKATPTAADTSRKTSEPSVSSSNPFTTTLSPAVTTASSTVTTSGLTATTPSAAVTTSSPTDTASSPILTTTNATDTTSSPAATTPDSAVTAPDTQQEPPQNTSGGAPDSGAAHDDHSSTTNAT